MDEVDSLDILVLVDNATDMLSSTPAHVESESAGLMRRGVRMMGGKCLCCAAHGLSCLITVERGGVRRTMLFDTGPEEYAFERNVTRLGADLAPVEAIMLSHGHWDHAGAMLLALNMIRARNGGKQIAFDAHPDMFRTRAVKMANGSFRQMEDVPSIDDLTAFGATVMESREPHALLDGMVHVSGEIPRVTAYRARLSRSGPPHRRRAGLGAGRASDRRALARHPCERQGAGGAVGLFACRHRQCAAPRPRRVFRTCRYTRSWAGFISPAPMKP